ncbi:hypothetical protein COLU111180_04120 [Cohnella lubricantis]|uniref:Uncharacterized protein n=1 Tax=Cohnella lubricantis TaxID=2163172 RepID=A0A841T912_9BACL|nr:hypothetical protein [Cohnella lubricantis]MBB6676505.1 hypothetical protein [Cohnella lubricantis]MBP2117125.1 membrane protein involved in colicin uptake [Cohnella lubricantis]
MKVKITAVTKVNGSWKGPGAEVDVDEKLGEELIEKRVGVEIEKSAAEKEAEEKAAAEAKAAAKAAKEAEKAEKELKSLRKKAAELGIEGADEKDAETLTAEIAAKEQK